MKMPHGYSAYHHVRELGTRLGGRGVSAPMPHPATPGGAGAPSTPEPVSRVGSDPSAGLTGDSEGSAWRPIETAPRDGSTVLLLVRWMEGRRPHPIVATWALRREWATYHAVDITRADAVLGWLPVPPPAYEEVEDGE